MPRRAVLSSRKAVLSGFVLFLISSVCVVALGNTIVMKRVLVTGGNKGIGRAICQTLLEEHPDVHVLLGSRDASRGKQAIEELRKTVGASVVDDRLDLVEIDTSSTESVERAAESVGDTQLYGIVNNAGIGFEHTTEDLINTNYFGPRRVNDAFGKLLVKPGGRVVNVASASGPNFVSSCVDPELRKKLAEPLTIAGGIDELDELAKTVKDSNGYGLSKALLNAYTVLYAKSEPDLIINSVTPGWINTDLTAGMGASNPPSKGAVPPVWMLMSPDLEKLPTGRYYGSDCVRSPMHVYRSPGDPPYEGP